MSLFLPSCSVVRPTYPYHSLIPPVKQPGGASMATTLKQMMDTANAAVPRITPEQARELIEQGNTLVVDVREAPEVEKSCKIAGALNVSRSFLEFRADPDSPS